VTFEEARSALAETENILAASFRDAETEAALADDAAALLLCVLVAVQGRTGETNVHEDGTLEGDTDVLCVAALVYIGARALRVMRASRAVLVVGYEPEARALDRILVELLAHRQAIVADDTATEALAWLQGERGRGITKRVTAITPEGMYRNLSHDSHGDPVPVLRLIAEDERALQLAPRRTVATRATLLMHAGFARDQAVLTAQAAGVVVKGVEDLDVAIRAAWDRLNGEAPSTAPPASA
jgi:hypothetical protein